MRRTEAGSLRRDHSGQRVLLQGWIHQRRPHGGLTFLNLRDRSGRVQVVLRPEEFPAAAAALDAARLEWVIEVRGTVVAREAGAVNPRMATGEIEVVAEEATVLTAAEPLPFGPETPVEEVAEDTRLRYRYLDLRRADLQRNLILRDRITLAIRNFFHRRGFLHLETPILTRSTPEGARDYLVPSRVRRGSFYALPQSPQVFKQIFQVAGFEKYVQIARCFRDEDLRADRQPEFTQVDVEMSFVDEDDVLGLIEDLFGEIFPLVGIDPPQRFPRLTFADAMARYGTDRPDLRIDLEIADLTELLGATGFRAFRNTVAEGGVVRGLRVPGGADASRKTVDGWAETARREGAAGVLTLRRRAGAVEFQVKDVLEPAELEAAAAALALDEGDLAVLVAASASVAAGALGALRVAIARQRDLVDESRHEFLWVTEFPLVEYDDEEKRWVALHHPFTSPRPEDVERLEEAPAAVRARAYDVVLDGAELGGGSIRIHDRRLQERVFALLGMDADEAAARFGHLLDALRYGAPPHGGIALGLDRIVMMMAGAGSLRDVIAFPKTTSAACLMTDAPGPVDAGQLAELGLAFTGDAGEES